MAPERLGLAAGLADGLAGLGADRLRDILGTLIGQIGRPQQHRHPLMRRGLPLHPCRGLGVIDGRRGVVNRGHRHRTDGSAVVRGAHHLGCTVARAAPFAGKQHLHHKPFCSEPKCVGGVEPPAPQPNRYAVAMKATRAMSERSPVTNRLCCPACDDAARREPDIGAAVRLPFTTNNAHALGVGARELFVATRCAWLECCCDLDLNQWATHINFPSTSSPGMFAARCAREALLGPAAQHRTRAHQQRPVGSRADAGTVWRLGR